MDHPDRSVYCRTCRRALNMLTGPYGHTELMHATEARGQSVDHPPDPIPLSKLANPIIECDFCSGRCDDHAVVYLVPDQHTRTDRVTRRVVDLGDYQRRHHAARTRRVETSPAVTNVWGTRWSACHSCAALVDAGDLHGLITRVVDSLPAKLTRGKRLPQTRGHLHNLYSALFDGPPRRAQTTRGEPPHAWDPPVPPTPEHHDGDRKSHE